EPLHPPTHSTAHALALLSVKRRLSPPSFFLYAIHAHRHPHSFPTRRSSDLPIDPAAASAGPGPLVTHLYERLPQIGARTLRDQRSEEHTSELQSPYDLVCRLLLEKKK